MILTGDCREILPTLPADSVHCCVTSPPYFGLRSYLRSDHPDKAKEIGSEQLHDCLGWATGATCGDCFVCVMVDVFRLVRRVLRPDGVLWVNLGDSYAGSWGAQSRDYSDFAVSTLSARQAPGAQRKKSGTGRAPSGLKPKDMMGMPWRVAFALQADGWWWRDAVVWHKPNPMPSSVDDRCTPAWEPVLMLTKSARYHFDWQEIATPANSGGSNGVGWGYADGDDAKPRTVGRKHPAGWASHDGAHGSIHQDGRDGKSRRNSFARATKTATAQHGQTPQHREGRENVDYSGLARRRNVWTIPTQGYSAAHFATFPEALPELCILATCPPGGTVLDIFHGSGTTGQVAQRHGREWIGIDLNDAYRPLQEARAMREQPGLPLSGVGA